MPALAPVRGGVPHQRIVATTDVTAGRTATQVHPPTAGGIAFNASGAARWYRRIDRFTHVCELTGGPGAGTARLRLDPI
jgi:hypothetical protein